MPIAKPLRVHYVCFLNCPKPGKDGGVGKRMTLAQSISGPFHLGGQRQSARDSPRRVSARIRSGIDAMLTCQAIFGWGPIGTLGDFKKGKGGVA